MTVVLRDVTLRSMDKITIPVCRCLRCSYEWVPRKPEIPLRCPKCGTPYWNRARKEQA